MPTRQAGCIGALKIVQRHRRWVDDDGIADVAHYLKMSREELDSIATFYNLIFRRPVGEHVIYVCDSITCWIDGYREILAHLTKKLGVPLGETTGDGKFTLLPIPCLGLCDKAPAMIVDTTTYGELTPGKIDVILNEVLSRNSHG